LPLLSSLLTLPSPPMPIPSPTTHPNHHLPLHLNPIFSPHPYYIHMSHKLWDFVIIGAGPSGLTLAQILSHYYHNILVIDKNSSIGGCHRVSRIDGLFTEHSPRIYSSSYLTTKLVLSNANIDFSSLMTPLKVTLPQIISKYSVLSLRELSLLLKQYIIFISNFTYNSKHTTVKQFAQLNNFSTTSINFLDGLCRLTEGTDASHYTLFQFLSLINQQGLYSILQPTLPNDLGLLKLWQNYLQNNNVQFLLNATITSLLNPHQIQTNSSLTISSKNFIFTIPPSSLINIHNLPKYLPPSFPSYAKNSQYNNYISITFHWNSSIHIPNIPDFPIPPWGIIFIPLTNYLTDPNSKTIISSTITLLNTPSPFTNKTANQSSQSQLIQETFRQISHLIPNLPQPTISLLSPNSYFDYSLNSWINTDTPHFLSTDGFLPNQILSNNLFITGNQNGFSHYAFNSMESAVSNAVHLANTLVPHSKHKYYIKNFWKLSHFIYIILLLFIVYLIYYALSHKIFSQKISSVKV
jgi:NAD(P)-binding Rossmann-like domain